MTIVKNLPFLPYAAQVISDADRKAVFDSLEAKMITRGETVSKFEEAIASYCGAQYAVAFNSGSSALAAAYWAVEVGPADQVVTTSNSYVATVGSAIQFGATPAFVDIECESGNLDLGQLISNIPYQSTRGKVVLTPVHYAGIAVDLNRLHTAASRYNCVIIEDAAQALGSHYPTGEKVGSCCYSDLTIFSFHPAKIITTGEGGAALTNNKDLYRRLKQYRNNGITRDLPNAPGPWYYEVDELTGNYHFTDFQAALGLSQLSQLDHFISNRQKLVEHYYSKLKDHPHIEIAPPRSQTAYHLAVVQIDYSACNTTRKALMENLYQEGIGTQVHYIPLYLHPALIKRCGSIEEYFPNANAFYAKALSLPLYSSLTTSDVDRICDTLIQALKS